MHSIAPLNFKFWCMELNLQKLLVNYILTMTQVNNLLRYDYPKCHP